MKQIIKTSYAIRILFFILHFYFVFIMLENILDTKYIGIVFLTFYLFYILCLLFQLLSKKRRYKQDLIYNIMQIGLYFYLTILSIRIKASSFYTLANTNSYFFTNYGILSLLILFIMAYSFLEFRKEKK